MFVRICIVSPYPPTGKGFGGIARSSGFYAEALLRAGYDVSFLTTRSSLDGETTAADLEERYRGMKAYTYRASLSKRWAVGAGILRFLPLVLTADLVMIQGIRSFTTLFAGLLRRISGRPYVVVPHAGLDASRVDRTRAKRPLLYATTLAPFIWAVRGARGLLVTGELEQSTLVREARCIPCRPVENFFDFAIDSVFARDRPPNPIYLFVGRIDSDKGVLSFCRAWGRAASENSELWLVGAGDGEYFEMVMQCVSSDRRMTYFGEVSAEAVHDLMRRASVIVLPTGMDAVVTENFGNVVVEAFVAGRPVMVTRGLHWDQYDGSPAIYLFSPDAGSARAVIQYFEALDEKSYRVASEAAAQLASRFHIDAAVPKLTAVVNELADVPRPCRSHVAY